MKERLAKFLARAGVASRRKCEIIMAAGRVTVNGRTVVEPGAKADPAADEIKVDGAAVKAVEDNIYLMLNKPAGYVTTARDTHGRKTVMDLLPPLPVRIYPVGRLDLDTEGLLLFTSDGRFAHLIMHPRHEINKVYEGLLEGVPAPTVLLELQRGIILDGQATSPAKIEILRVKTGKAMFKMEIHEGRKRQIRRMWAAMGFKVLRLKRTAVGPLEMGTLPLGRYRNLTPQEVESLQKACGERREYPDDIEP
ncbi:MAG: pseudouridine synthase [Bacillota bacterium]